MEIDMTDIAAMGDEIERLTAENKEHLDAGANRYIEMVKLEERIKVLEDVLYNADVLIRAWRNSIVTTPDYEILERAIAAADGSK